MLSGFATFSSQSCLDLQPLARCISNNPDYMNIRIFNPLIASLLNRTNNFSILWKMFMQIFCVMAESAVRKYVVEL